MTLPTPDGNVHVKINHSTASKRTRNRVREGGPEFQYFINTNRIDSILLRSEKTGWMGWLPLSEIAWEPA
jgi:hypothetical protein